MTPTKQSTPHEVIGWAVELTGHAPSLYNAQPWSWRVSDDGADLYMDVTRGFQVSDPDQREMRIGCGAALHHLQVALAAAGCEWELKRDSGLDGGLLARVRITRRCEIDQRAVALVDAMQRRHTDRRPFSTLEVPDDLLELLQSALDSHGVHLQIVTHDEHRIWLSVLTERAAALQSAREGYSDELARVTGTHDAPGDVPADVVPHVVSPRHSDVTLRDFELQEPGALEIPESVDEHPVWCVLWTDRDTELDWLQSGEALSALLLTATEHGLGAGIQSQPVEVPMIRAQLAERLLSNMGHAQVLIRLGWPGSPEGEHPPSLRRS